MAEDHSPAMRVITELEQCVRERDVRVPERMAIIDKLAGGDGEVALHAQLVELRERIESTASSVRKALS